MRPPPEAARQTSPGTGIRIALAMPILGLCLPPQPLAAQEAAVDAGGAGAAPQRPAIGFNRWQEDWSVLADPRVAPEPLDFLKYIPLSAGDPQTYLSFGADVRERYEHNDAALFGTGGNRGQDYDISRLELHADLRITSHVQIFTQLQSDYAPGKVQLTAVDQDRLDLEQAFVAFTGEVDGGTLKLRFGRQQFAFDLQRFVSVRDGPNVRQSYDAVWGDYEHGPWRFITFGSHPVVTKDSAIFDDASSRALSLSGARLERKLTDRTSATVYFARYEDQGARFLGLVADERRDVVDLHLASRGEHVDWDVEGMRQEGRFGSLAVSAWGFGSLGGYTFTGAWWSPRLGLQIDGASGDHNRGNQTLGTFDPLLPNGAYVSLSGYTGYVNFIQVKPSVTVQPARSLKLLVAVAPQWRQTTADAVYAQPLVPVPDTAGRPGAYTGTYEQLRIDWAASRGRSFALEAVRFNVGEVVRSAGGHDSNYLGVQVAQGW